MSGRRSRRSREDLDGRREARHAARRAARLAQLELIGGSVGCAEGLPIAERAAELIAAIRDHQVIVVAGETGSGKSTQLPKLCLAAGRGVEGMIGHTQPRRVAARTVAERVADELGTTIGAAVGYTVRFNDQVGESTLLRVMTDGILLNELQRDRELRRYDTLIVDEAHERSLNVDFLLGYLKQLLPRRPDLKLIVTSATIDTERFAAHFAAPDGTPAPVFTVEGRTYPVEVRYRPFGGDDPDDPGDDRDLVRAVLDAIAELDRESPGDVLVFLSGEREIHDLADAIRDEITAGGLRGPIEVLPLYARLSAVEQHRIFQPSRHRRVVLATNVAETSITVPGVRYVIDAGTARISRYSKRLKVQRLPIEPVSQASANQRAGRCGRVAPGVCIRLYTEADFALRPEFTEPEILRTNLASVVLQMAAIGLGDVERFPFVEAPDPSSIRDGYLLLDELGAFDGDRDERRLSPNGRALARLPIDPRLARMVIEADRQGCVREVLVIASALSIQDVRERPRPAAGGDSPEKVAELHRRFDVDGSDLLSIVALWDHLREQQARLSGNQFRRLCRDEHLNYLRVREWRDLYSQLRQVAGELGIRPGVEAAHPDHVHRAVLAGLLSHLGVRDGERRDFKGARDSRFVIAPGSVLTRRPPRWVMAGELVETSQLFARRVAAIQPEWAEQLAGHLVKRSYGEAWWDARSARAVTSESVTLYGLPIVANRTIGVDRVDPVLARRLFIEHALVAGDWDTRHEFVGHNHRFVERVRLLEARVRRRDLLDDDALFEFYDERIGDDVTSGRHFDRWWRDARRDRADLLDLDPSVLASRRGIVLADYPDEFEQHGNRYPISYRFEPDTALDGAAITVPVAALAQFDGDGLDWLVPGYRRELVQLLVRSLPKDVRRELIPLTETADAAHALLGRRRGRLVDALAQALSSVTGLTIEPSWFDSKRLPTHLRFHVVVTGVDGAVIDAGDDPSAIRDRLAGTARAALAAVAPVPERRDIVRWDIGRLERIVEQQVGPGQVVRAYPTLLDRGNSVALRVVDNEALQLRAMRGGVRRLLLMLAAPTAAKVERSLGTTAKLAIAASGSDVLELASECIEAAVDAVMDGYELPWDECAFGALESAVRGEAQPLAADALATAADVLGAANRARARLGALRAEGWQPTVADASAHLARLIGPGWVRRAGTARLPDVHRYVRGIEYRLDHLAGDIGRDQRRMAEVVGLEREVFTAAERHQRIPDPLRQAAWSLEELRIATFAQPLGVKGSASPKKIREAVRAAT